MHGDHMDGAVHLGGKPVLVQDREIVHANSRSSRFFAKVLRQPIPSGVDFQPLTLDDGPFGAFGASKALTEDGRIVAVPTPGHTPGHISIVCVDDEGRQCSWPATRPTRSSSCAPAATTRSGPTPP